MNWSDIFGGEPHIVAGPCETNYLLVDSTLMAPMSEQWTVILPPPQADHSHGRLRGGADRYE